MLLLLLLRRVLLLLRVLLHRPEDMHANFQFDNLGQAILRT